jgi:hypothetical protein
MIPGNISLGSLPVLRRPKEELFLLSVMDLEGYDISRFMAIDIPEKRMISLFLFNASWSCRTTISFVSYSMDKCFNK